MSTFESIALGALVLMVLALVGIASALEKHTRHLSNIADRLLDINNTLNKRP